MRCVIAKFGIHLPLGKTGENLVTQVRFPVVKLWKKLYGEGTFQLVNQRPDDDYVYACVIEQDEDNIIWNVTNTDLAQAGSGNCELQYYIGQHELAKSLTWKTVIGETIYTDEHEPPDPWKPWVEEDLRVNSDYEALKNHPSINDEELVGNKTSEDLGLQDQLIDGETIKTINGESILGPGNIEIIPATEGNYNDLSNKPQINQVELIGNKTLDDLDIQVKGEYADSALTNMEIEHIINSFI